MTAACDSSLPSVSNPSTALALAHPAALAAGEDPATYDDLLARVAAAVKPDGVIEDLWVRDVADDAWEVLRLRRYKAGYLAACRRDGMAAVLAGLGETMSHTLAQRWAAREPTALGDVRERMADAGLGHDAVMGSAFAQHIDEFDRIERLIGVAMARRAATLREIARHRAELAEQLAAATQMAAAQNTVQATVDDAEYTVVASAPGAGEKAA
jgi:uncharacterized protein YidB (DUF937 family)